MTTKITDTGITTYMLEVLTPDQVRAIIAHGCPTPVPGIDAVYTFYDDYVGDVWHALYEIAESSRVDLDDPLPAVLANIVKAAIGDKLESHNDLAERLIRLAFEHHAPLVLQYMIEDGIA